MAVEVLDEGIIKVLNPTGDVYILAATARGCAFGEDMTARWREVEACQRRDAVQGYMNTYAQRKAALERSAEARRERMEFKELVKKGEISLADALDDDRAKRIRVHEFLMCIPGIGKAKADDIMRKLGIAENRRVQGLGSRQREGIVELVAKLK